MLTIHTCYIMRKPGCLQMNWKTTKILQTTSLYKLKGMSPSYTFTFSDVNISLAHTVLMLPLTHQNLWTLTPMSSANPSSLRFTLPTQVPTTQLGPLEEVRCGIGVSTRVMYEPSGSDTAVVTNLRIVGKEQKTFSHQWKRAINKFRLVGVKLRIILDYLKNYFRLVGKS